MCYLIINYLISLCVCIYATVFTHHYQERESCWVGLKDTSWPMHSCGKTAINGCSWPNSWANVVSFSLRHRGLAFVGLQTCLGPQPLDQRERPITVRPPWPSRVGERNRRGRVLREDHVGALPAVEEVARA